MYISPGSTQTEILNRFAHAEYNAAAMQLTGNFVNRPAFKQKRRRLFDRGVFL